jgi:membrane protease subunit HflC
MLLAAAEAHAKKIRGEGDAEAAQYYKMLEQEPKLAIFLRNLDALVATLKERATIVIPADADPFALLTGMPSFGPSQPRPAQTAPVSQPAKPAQQP